MKVIAFNTSARKDGNTAILIKQVFKELGSLNIKTELIQLSGQKISGCIACGQCAVTKNNRCALADDPLNEYLAKMIQADGIIIGSPTYFADCTAGAKALMERAGMVSRANNNLFKRSGLLMLSAKRKASLKARPYSYPKQSLSPNPPGHWPPHRFDARPPYSNMMIRR